MNKSESKYFNTAVLFDNALISLLENKDFQYISVKEICQKAGVNRSTFYLHYDSVVDLLEETTEYINSQFLSSFEKTPTSFVDRIHEAPLGKLVLINDEFLEPYLLFVKEHKSIFKAVFNNPECLKANQQLTRLKQDILLPIMKRFRIPQEEQKYWISYYISGITAIIKEWIIGDCKESVEQMITIITQCVRPRNTLDDKLSGV